MKPEAQCDSRECVRVLWLLCKQEQTVTRRGRALLLLFPTKGNEFQSSFRQPCSQVFPFLKTSGNGFKLPFWKFSHNRQAQAMRGSYAELSTNTAFSSANPKAPTNNRTISRESLRRNLSRRKIQLQAFENGALPLNSKRIVPSKTQVLTAQQSTRCSVYTLACRPNAHSPNSRQICIGNGNFCKYLGCMFLV